MIGLWTVKGDIWPKWHRDSSIFTATTWPGNLCISRGDGSQAVEPLAMSSGVKMQRKRELGPLDQRKKVVRCEACTTKKIKVRVRVALLNIYPC